MHAIRQHEFGPVENLRYEELADPVPAPGQVGLAVEASGVHLIDTAIRRGQTGAYFPLAEAPGAHAALESRETVGKTVLVPSPNGGRTP